MSYLMARLSFSYVIFGFSFRDPHNFATFSLRTNLNIPSSWFSQQIRLGQYSRFRSKSLINSHSLPVFFSVQIKNHISSTVSGSGRFTGTHNENRIHLGPEFSTQHFSIGKFVLQVMAHNAYQSH